MRFVSPETVRIDLGSGDWIDVKKELTVGEEKRMRTAGVRRVNGQAEVDVNWAEMALARVTTYLRGWSAVDEKQRPIPVTAETVQALATEDFEAIDAAIQRHIEAVAEAKKAPSGTPTLTVA